ncbi:GNAT family N-acetyltransferase [Tunturiibacter lichenicola]|uniref:GNAT family N-acetyltransferase n=1 Tax=Tunturiibacter lichenicola TaxID=2051959 RepID=UPI0021B1E56E|nr:GNAT family N-acetyltransferase [Edaphobacter lichenicola]
MALSLVIEPPSQAFSSNFNHKATTSFFPHPVSTPPVTPPQPRSTPLRSELKTNTMGTRRAELQDAHAIHQLIKSFCHDGTLLARSYAEICANIRTFTVVETETHQFLGCAALHIYGQHLAEIRSIAVRPETKGHGAGGLLVQAILSRAEAEGIQCVCLFTRIPTFFEHFHFHVAERLTFRDKVLKDCIHCARRNACDEIAMAIGELPEPCDLPKNLFRTQYHSDLVQLQL